MNYEMKYRPDIDGLRAIAVLAVIFYHAFPKQIPGGFIGVDIFFVISGFLISTIIFIKLERSSFSFVDFYSRRIKRIFPVLIVVLATCLVVGWFHLLPVDLKQLGEHVAAGAGFISNFVLWNEAGYFDKSAEVKPLLHLWSLGIEEQFYLFWPAFTWIFWKIKRKNPYFLLLIIFIISLIISLLLTRSNSASAFYLPISRFWELCLGSILSWTMLKHHDFLNVFANKYKLRIDVLRNNLSIFGLILIILSIGIISKSSSFPGILALLPTLGTLMLISAGPSGFFNKKLLSTKIAIGIGLISYPLYLWHWPAFAYLNIIGFDIAPSVIQFWKIGLIFASFLLSIISYFLIEKPIRNGVHDRIKVLSLVTLMISVGIIGFIFYRSDGYIQRYPDEIKSIISPINFNLNLNARFGICHNDSRVKGTVKMDSPVCLEKKRPLVLIWGDSYAAALYPGLKHIQSIKKFGIWQATECGTPPVLDINWDNACKNANEMNQWNQDVLMKLSKVQPDYVILHSYWNAYGNSEWIFKKLYSLIKVIKKNSPISKIIFIGPVPEWGTWADGLPLYLYRYWKVNGKKNMAPIYMKYGLSANVKYDDPNLIIGIKKLGIKYISAYDVLCNENGCLTRTGPNPIDISTIDQGHLSKAGSEFLMEHISEKLFN